MYISCFPWEISSDNFSLEFFSSFFSSSWKFSFQSFSLSEILSKLFFCLLFMIFRGEGKLLLFFYAFCYVQDMMKIYVSRALCSMETGKSKLRVETLPEMLLALFTEFQMCPNEVTSSAWSIERRHFWWVVNRNCLLAFKWLLLPQLARWIYQLCGFNFMLTRFNVQSLSMLQNVTQWDNFVYNFLKLFLSFI